MSTRGYDETPETLKPVNGTTWPSGRRPTANEETMTNAQIVERILFRRALEKKLEGYTLETSLEIVEALRGREPGPGR